MIKNYYKNYGALIVDQIICNKDNKNTMIKVDKLLNNFSQTIINLQPEETKNLLCTHVNFIDKFEDKSFLLKIDHVNSEYNYDKFKDINKNKWSFGKNILIVNTGGTQSSIGINELLKKKGCETINY